MKNFLLYLGDRHFSSWSMRAKVALVEMGVSFDEIALPLDVPVKYIDNKKVVGIKEYDIPPEPASGCGCEQSHLLKLDTTGLIENSYTNLVSRVPVLIDVHNQAVLSDTLAIVEYLEENYKSTINSILGEDAKMRAEVRSFSYHIHSDYLPLMGGLSFSKSFYYTDKSTVTEQALNQLDELLKIIDILLQKRSPYIFSKFSLADVMLCPIAQSIIGWDIPINHRISNYFSLLTNRESIRKHLDEAKKLYSVLNNYEEDSYPWIAYHYRYLKELSLIHNWRSDVYHHLENDMAKIFFEKALEGKNRDEIINEILLDFEVENINEIIRDIDNFFKEISPKADSKYKDVNFFYKI